MAASVNAGVIHRVVHHVFLPPQLPQQADEATEIDLVNNTLNALHDLKALLQPDSPSMRALDDATALLETIKAINSLPGGEIDETQLLRFLESLPVGRMLAVMVSAQNAAVLITRQLEHLVVEEFELSALNAQVVQTRGRLVRTFPGLAIAVPASLLDQYDFPTMIANTLSTMCHQQAPDMR